MYYPNVTIEQIQQRILPKIQRRDGHWMWTGAKSSAGYPYWSEGLRKRNWRVHRLIYAIVHGIGLEDRDDIVIDHICNIKLCVNPKHLQKITQSENLKRVPSKDGTHIYFHISTHTLIDYATEVKYYPKKHKNGLVVEYPHCVVCRMAYSINPTIWRVQRELDKQAETSKGRAIL